MARYITILFFVVTAYAAHGQATHSVTVAVGQPAECEVVLGLEESNLFKIYPNPVSSSFKIESSFKGAKIRITDLKGREVLRGLLSAGNLEVDVSSLNSGIYILHFRFGRRSDQIKIQVL